MLYKVFHILEDISIKQIIYEHLCFECLIAVRFLKPTIITICRENREVRGVDMLREKNNHKKYNKVLSFINV